jgi:hypothetical protein
MKMSTSLKPLLGLVLSIVIGSTIWYLFYVLEEGDDPQSHDLFWSIGYPVMIVAALILGSFFRRGAWKWGVVMILAQFVFMCSIFNCASPQLPFGIVIQAVLMVPLILASYLGVWIVRFWHRRSPPSS